MQSGVVTESNNIQEFLKTLSKETIAACDDLKILTGALKQKAKEGDQPHLTAHYRMYQRGLAISQTPEAEAIPKAILADQAKFFEVLDKIANPENSITDIDSILPFINRPIINLIFDYSSTPILSMDDVNAFNYYAQRFPANLSTRSHHLFERIRSFCIGASPEAETALRNPKHTRSPFALAAEKEQAKKKEIAYLGKSISSAINPTTTNDDLRTPLLSPSEREVEVNSKNGCCCIIM